VNDRPHTTLDYATPSADVTRPVTSIPLTVSFSSIYLVIFASVFLIVPKMERVFRDFRIEMPAVTRLFFFSTQRFGEGHGWAALLPVPVLLPILITQLTWRANAIPDTTAQWRRARLMAAVTLGIILLVLAMVLFAPLLFLVPNIHGAKGVA
jgi:type II secretory pathway component PulF